ncbi:hypothetical protein Nepgr_032747 [Nepenthes gracilis]|uniref:G3BP-like protein n=1 Tax=Nepenthes gracilis TaxID=150966 RepID=A0AAD3TKN6_NEPGR|nr:hypothetical protein Nepgr_032747 [Nepenthes gracilis]
MASGTITAFQIGSYFIQQYYEILQESPHFSHQFYTDASTVTRIDGDANDATVSTPLEIHSLLTSLNYTGIEVVKLKCQNSWNGGILVMVLGYVKSRNFSGRRRFTQTFFLAPQEKGFFVHNDVFQFIDEDSANQQGIPEIPEIKIDSEVHASPHLVQQTVSNFDLDEETREYVTSIHIEADSPVDKYSVPDEQQSQEPEAETVVGEALVEESPPFETMDAVLDTQPAPINESVGESARLTYASILRAPKGSVPLQPPVRQSFSATSEQYHRVQTTSPQLNPSATSFVPEAVGAGRDEAAVQEEDELTSVYVRNLPAHVTVADIEKEFRNFGRIKPNGVFIRNRKEVGVCFAFVEFEDISGVQNAIKASPIQLLRRQVYIEERRASSNSSSRGGGRGRGRGRGSNQTDASRSRGGARNPGQGSIPDGSDYSRIRGNEHSGFDHLLPGESEGEEESDRRRCLGASAFVGIVSPISLLLSSKPSHCQLRFPRGLQASPIQLLRRQVYIEERRASSNSSSRGGGRGRAEAEEVTKLMHQGAVVVLEIPAKEASQMAVTIPESEGTVFILAVLNREEQ